MADTAYAGNSSCRGPRRRALRGNAAGSGQEARGENRQRGTAGCHNSALCRPWQLEFLLWSAPHQIHLDLHFQFKNFSSFMTFYVHRWFIVAILCETCWYPKHKKRGGALPFKALPSKISPSEYFLPHLIGCLWNRTEDDVPVMWTFCGRRVAS